MLSVIAVTISNRSIISSVWSCINYTVCIIRNSKIYVPGSVNIVSIVNINISGVMRIISIRVIMYKQAAHLN